MLNGTSNQLQNDEDIKKFDREVIESAKRYLASVNLKDASAITDGEAARFVVAYLLAFPEEKPKCVPPGA